MDFARGRLAPVISPASRCDRCSAFTQQLPELACASADLRASTSWLPQAGTKRQPGRRASGRCKLSSGLLAPLSHPTGSSGWYGRQGAARRSWVRGLVSVHPPRWLTRPPPAAHSATCIAQMTAKIVALDVAVQGALKRTQRWSTPSGSLNIKLDEYNLK